VKKGQLAEARESLGRALAADPGTPVALPPPGVLAAAGDRARAVREYERVTKDDPRTRRPTSPATLYAEQKQMARRKRPDVLVAKVPGSHLGYYYRGRLRASRKKFEPALADFDKALAISPGFDAAMLDSGAVLEILGRNAEAEERYRQALQTSPDNTLLRERLGRLLVREKKLDQAGGEYEELKKFSPSSTDVRSKLGLLYLERDQYDAAINEFTSSSRRAGEHQVGFFLGTRVRGEGTAAEAMEAFRANPRGRALPRRAAAARPDPFAAEDGREAIRSPGSCGRNTRRTPTC
jgi:tetratricopeptide (TPR) repeat protein